MIIKRFTIGSDDDDFTLLSLIGIHTVYSGPEGWDNALMEIRDDEQRISKVGEYQTESLDEFVDREFWAAAYDNGFRTYMSMSMRESNEIVYLINAEARI